MPRYGRFGAIYFFETSGGVLRGSRGVRLDPEAESYEARNEILDQKSRFFYGNVPPTDIFQISIEKSTFSVENFVSSFMTLGLWVKSNTSATSKHSTRRLKKVDSAEAAISRHFKAAVAL